MPVGKSVRGRKINGHVFEASAVRRPRDRNRRNGIAPSGGAECGARCERGIAPGTTVCFHIFLKRRIHPASPGTCGGRRGQAKAGVPEVNSGAPERYRLSPRGAGGSAPSAFAPDAVETMGGRGGRSVPSPSRRLRADRSVSEWRKISRCRCLIVERLIVGRKRTGRKMRRRRSVRGRGEGPGGRRGGGR